MKNFYLVLVLLATITACKNTGQKVVTDSDVAHNNKAVGLMGQFKYADAKDIFTTLVEAYPGEDLFSTNLAIATLNRQNPGDDKAALAILEKILETTPDHQIARYCAGLLHLYLGNEDSAFTHFSAVKGDAYANYQIAQILANRGQLEDALTRYDLVLKQDPYLRSAYYGAFRANQQAGNRDRALELLTQFQKLKDNPRAHLFEIKYTRMGPLAEVRTLDQTLAITAPSGALFGEPQILGKEDLGWIKPDTAPSLTAVDFNHDGHLDLFQAPALQTEAGVVNIVWINDGHHQFTAINDHPLSQGDGINAVLWGDYDNDGLVDAYFCRTGANQLWRQTDKGQWQDVTATTMTANGEAQTVAGAFFDADHDGDLDLFLINGDGPNELLNNNRDGSFRSLGQSQGLDGGQRPSRNLVVGDFDGDRDADILVIHASPPHQVFINDRLWSYHQSPAFSALEKSDMDTAFLTDLEGDGVFDLLTLGQAGDLNQWQTNRQGQWTSKRLHSLANQELRTPASVTLADFDGDGRSELLYRSDPTWSLVHISHDPANTSETQGPGPGLVTFLPIVLDPQAGYALAGIDHSGRLVLIPAGAGRHPFLSVSFSGKEDTGQAMRSNASGIGTEVAARAGRHWTIAHNYPVIAAPGQSHQPLALGLGGAQTADFLTLQWSDGVYQTELGMTTAKGHHLTETQRQLSSCPVVFAWDGEKHQFISDVLGVAGIGFALGDGTYSQPRPWENFLLPAGLAQPKDGRYILKISEPMEEAAYIDSARLVRYQLPAGWDMVMDERMWISGPKPSGDPIFFRQEIQPEKVINDRGEDVTQSLAEADFKAAPIGTKDHRFLGRLATENQLTLTFDQPINPEDRQPVLVMDGWVEYPYSQTMFAAWQADATFDAPTLEARDRKGRWHTVYRQFGYPAGMPRRMALPLPLLPAGTTALRLRSNLEIYWDRIAIVYAEPCPEVIATVLPLTHATLNRSGFAKRTTGPQMLPNYDYQNLVPLWDTRYMAGYYTQPGPILPLLASVDDALAIIGPGEEIHLEFQAGQAANQGTTRLVLEIHGWCKDMDMFTKDGETLGPIPSTGLAPQARERLHARYNTRYQAGR